jgi:hypothetical protein
MDGISILWRPNSIYSDQTCRSSVGGYCDHQENRKSVIGRDHLRVPSGVPLPAAGLSAASGLYTSRWAEVARTLPQGETELSGATAHFPNLKSRYSEPQATRKKGSFEKLHFSLTRGLAQVSHWRKYKKRRFAVCG